MTQCVRVCAWVCVCVRVCVRVCVVSRGQTAFFLLVGDGGKRVWLPFHRNSVRWNRQKLASVNEALMSRKDLSNKLRDWRRCATYYEPHG